MSKMSTLLTCSEDCSYSYYYCGGNKMKNQNRMKKELKILKSKFMIMKNKKLIKKI